MHERQPFEPPNPFKDTTGIEYQVGGRLKGYHDPEKVSWFLYRRDSNGDIAEKRIVRESYIKDVIREQNGERPQNP